MCLSEKEETHFHTVPSMKVEVNLTCPTTLCFLFAFSLGTKQRSSQRIKSSLLLFLSPPLRPKPIANRFLPDRVRWLYTELSTSSLAQGHLHRCLVSGHPQASYQKNQRGIHSSSKASFSKSFLDTSCHKDEILELQPDSCNSVKGAEGTEILSAN